MKRLNQLLSLAILASSTFATVSCKFKSSASEAEKTDWDDTVESEVEAVIKKKFKIDLKSVWKKSATQPTGGRSWTELDEVGFSNWIDNVPQNILDQWKIPHDCNDAVVALRWMYAVQNGLALKYNEGMLNSITYAKDPVGLLRAASNSLPSQNLVLDATYLVDMTHRNNFRGGLVVDTYKHVIILRGALRQQKASELVGDTIPKIGRMAGAAVNNVLDFKLDKMNYAFTTLSSTSPTDRRTLREYPFNYSITKGDEISYMHFSRYFPVKNENGKLSYNKEMAFKLFPKSTTVSETLIEKCSNGQKANGGTLLWLNLVNYIWAVDKWEKPNSTTRSVENIKTCQHNIVQKDKTKFPPPDYVSLFKTFVADLCPSLQMRAQVVNEGFEHCYQTGASKCTTDPEDDFSTPGRDTALHRNMIGLINFAGQAKLNFDYKAHECVLDMLKVDPKVQVNFMKRFKNFAGSNAAEVEAKLRKKVVHPFKSFSNWDTFKNMNPAPATTNPTASYPIRWGCKSSEASLSCLK